MLSLMVIGLVTILLVILGAIAINVAYVKIGEWFE